MLANKQMCLFFGRQPPTNDDKQHVDNGNHDQQNNI